VIFATIFKKLVTTIFYNTSYF